MNSMVAEALMALFDDIEEDDYTDIKFSVPIKVENDFSTIRCDLIRVYEPEGQTREEAYRPAVEAMMRHANNAMATNLNRLLRELPWPTYYHKDKKGQAYASRSALAVLDHEMKAAVRNFTMEDPAGLATTVNHFCNADTKHRIFDLLENIADANNVGVEEYVTLIDDRLHLHLERITDPEDWKWLKLEYNYEHPGGGFIRSIGIDTTTDVRAPFLEREYSYRVTVITEGIGPGDPEGEFVMEFTQVLKPVFQPQPKPMVDICLDVIADQFYVNWERTKLEQERFMTVRAMEIPEILVMKVIVRYRELKDKMVTWKAMFDRVLVTKISLKFLGEFLQ